MKMEKTPRYTQRERNMVLGYAAQYKDIIENKRTDAESNRKKDEVWRQIAKEFNARVYHQRSSKQLRQLYKNMKLLLKKDLCGEGKGNRTFMDLLNTISQQESVAQYISEQMSPNGYSSSGNGRGNAESSALCNISDINVHNGGSNHHQKYNGDCGESKLHSLNYSDGMDTDIIVIKSEDISDNEHNADMDDDDDDCLSTKDIPEVCLEEEDEEIFATDLRQSNLMYQHHQQQLQQSQSVQQDHQLPKLSIMAKQQQSTLSTAIPQTQALPPTSTSSITVSTRSTQFGENASPDVQNVGGIRVGSIGSLANMKSIQNNGVTGNVVHDNNTTPLSLCHGTNGNTDLNLCQTTSEQQLQLLNGLGLSAVNAAVKSATSATPILPTPPPQSSPPIARTVSTSCRSSSASLLESITARLPALQRVKEKICGDDNANSGTYSSDVNNLLNHNSNLRNANISNVAQQLLLNINGHFNSSTTSGSNTATNNPAHHHQQQQQQNSNYNHHYSQHHYQREVQNTSTCTHLITNRSSTPHNCNSSSSKNSNNNHHNDYFILGLEERKLKIELLNAQIDYWKKLTKKLDESVNGGLIPNPTCMCHFPGKTNGIPTPASTS